MNQKTLPYKEGNWIVIYDAKLLEQSQAFKLALKRRGALLSFMAGFIGVGLFISPILYAELKAQNSFQDTKTVKKYIAQSIPNNYSIPQADKNTTEYNLFTEQEKLNWMKKTGISQNLDWNFSLIIPKIGLNTKVFPNIDPANKVEYMTVLKKGVAHAKFTALPGSEGLVYIFGHSTDYIWNIQNYNALFYSIKDLEPNDEIIVLYNNKPFIYKTLYQKIIDGDNLVYLNAQTNAKMIVLQTCWPPGTTWKRLIVVASQEEEQSL